MIEASHLTHTYGRTPALKDVSFTVEKGEILGFLGPNGSGKTTTMKILTGLLTPTGGQAWVAGYDIAEHPLEVKRRIGYLPENVPLYKDMRVYDYLCFVAEVKGLGKGSKLFQVGHVMDQCGIVDRGDQLIGRLSKGYRQRVGLAQALLADPEVLILDEPTEGLDPAQIIEIRHLIQRLGQDRTIILSTHILPEVSMIARRVVILYQGRIMAADTPENLVRQLHATGRMALQIEGPTLEVTAALQRLPGIAQVVLQASGGLGVGSYEVTLTDESVGKTISRLIYERGWNLLEMRSQGGSLEDVFVKLVTREEGGHGV